RIQWDYRKSAKVVLGAGPASCGGSTSNSTSTSGSGSGNVHGSRCGPGSIGRRSASELGQGHNHRTVENRRARDRLLVHSRVDSERARVRPGARALVSHARLYSISQMPIRTIPASLIILSAFFSSFAAAPRGIPRQLARLRAAQISNVRYRLAFVLTPKAGTASGDEEVRFNLKALEPVLLDIRDGQLLSASVNGTALTLKRENGHLELPREKLRAGECTIRIRF